MKYVLTAAILFGLLFGSGIMAQDENVPPPTLNTAPIQNPTPVTDHGILFRAGNFFFGGQPDEAALKWLAADGVTLVINLRTDPEMETVLAGGLDEPAVLHALGVAYVRIPMGGEAGFSPKDVNALHDALAGQSGRVLIHCTTGNRASWLWTAYLVRCRGWSIDDAVALTRKIRLYFPLSELLGYPLTIQRKK